MKITIEFFSGNGWNGIEYESVSFAKSQSNTVKPHGQFFTWNAWGKHGRSNEYEHNGYAMEPTNVESQANVGGPKGNNTGIYYLLIKLLG